MPINERPSLLWGRNGQPNSKGNEAPKTNEIVPSSHPSVLWGKQGSAPKEMGATLAWGQTLSKIAISSLLNAPNMWFNGKSTAEAMQLQFDRQINRILARFSPGSESLIPTDSVLLQTEQEIKDQYLDLQPYKDLGGEAKIDNIINVNARKLVKALYKGEADDQNEGKPTPEELILADHLAAIAAYKTPEELRQILDDEVFGVAADIAAKQTDNRLAKRANTTETQLKRLEFVRQPKIWFKLDWVTKQVTLTEEEKLVSAPMWGITPTELVIWNIEKLNDQHRLPLSRLTISGNIPNPIYMQEGTPEIIDRIRRFGGPKLNPLILKFSQYNKLGGSVIFRTTEADRPIAVLVVKNPQLTIQILNNLGSIIRGSYGTLSNMKDRLRKQEQTSKYPIRPNIVKSLLPSSAILEVPIRTNSKGRTQWDTLLPELDEIKAQAQKSLAMVLREAQNWLDSNGNPTRKADWAAIKYWQQRIRDIEDQISRTNQLLLNAPKGPKLW